MNPKNGWGSLRSAPTLQFLSAVAEPRAAATYNLGNVGISCSNQKGALAEA